MTISISPLGKYHDITKYQYGILQSTNGHSYIASYNIVRLFGIAVFIDRALAKN